MRHRFIATDGYILIHRPQHPHADANGNVREHRLKVEKAIGRILERKHPVHHFDENPGNNENANLVVCEDQRYHHLLHLRARVLRAGHDPRTHKWCTSCKVPHLPSEFNKDGYQNDGLSTYCRKASQAKDHRWHANNPDKVKAKHDSYHTRNRERINARKREMRKAGLWGNPHKRSK